MKIHIILLLIITLVSCTSIDSSRVAPGYFQAFNSLKQLVSGNEETIDSELIQNIPYASMLVRIGKGPEALMILEKVVDEEYTWVSADRVYLVINNGKIIKTHGLINNLSEKLTSNISWNDTNINGVYYSYYSFLNPTLNNLKVSSQYSYSKPTDVELRFGNKLLKLIEEKIESKEVGWKATNKYWLDDSNYVWKSTQNISPKLPEISFEVTKKPR